MNKSNINWCDYTWNPFTGCTRISPGCDNCYAHALAKRFPKIWGTDFNPSFHPGRLGELGKVKKPSRIFVCSMSDLFNDSHLYIDLVFDRMIQYTYHRFMILTKRPENMFGFLSNNYLDEDYYFYERFQHIALGITAENQECFDDRMPWMRKIRGIDAKDSIQFVSMEPMLEPIVMGDWVDYIDWVIVGPETGAEKRPFDLEWAFDVKLECDRAGIPFFLKGNTDYQEYPEGLKL